MIGTFHQTLKRNMQEISSNLTSMNIQRNIEIMQKPEFLEPGLLKLSPRQNSKNTLKMEPQTSHGPSSIIIRRTIPIVN
jgi:hypothetical protein